VMEWILAILGATILVFVAGWLLERIINAAEDVNRG